MLQFVGQSTQVLFNIDATIGGQTLLVKVDAESGLYFVTMLAMIRGEHEVLLQMMLLLLVASCCCSPSRYCICHGDDDCYYDCYCYLLPVLPSPPSSLRPLPPPPLPSRRNPLPHRVPHPRHETPLIFWTEPPASAHVCASVC